MTNPEPPTTGPEADPAEVTEEQTDDEHRDEDDEESFPRAVVVKLRDENAKLRVRAQQTDEHAERADTLAKRLHTELVRSKGLLADPTDLVFDPSHLDDDDRLTADIESLVTAKPHLKARKFGDVGQGRTGDQTPKADLGAILRSHM
jgi:hypothetical protein